jgi:hypothetical protein
MESEFLFELERTYKKCADWKLHDEHRQLLNELCYMELTKEIIDFLCEKIISKKHFWDVRFEYLRVLIVNPSSIKFELKDFYLGALKRSRRMAMKIFFIRGYASYATEEELTPIIKKFIQSLYKTMDDADWNYVISNPGLPYLVNTYKYDCLKEALEIAKTEYNKVKLPFKGVYTLDGQLNQVITISADEYRDRLNELENELSKDYEGKL